MMSVVALIELLLIPLRALATVFGGGFAARLQVLTDVIATLRAVDRLLRLAAEGKLPPVLERVEARRRRARQSVVRADSAGVREISRTPLTATLSPQAGGEGVFFTRAVGTVFAVEVRVGALSLALHEAALAHVRKIGGLVASWNSVLFVSISQFMAANPSGQGGKRLTLRA